MKQNAHHMKSKYTFSKLKVFL